MVSKTWNIFLINDRRLWMDILRQTQPYFKFLGNQLLNENISDDADRNFSKIYFDFVEKNEDDCCQNIIKIFKRIQMIHTVLQDVFQDCPVYHVFQKEFIGEKLAGEIQFQIDSVEKEKQPIAKFAKWGNHFKLNVSGLLEQIAELNVRREEIRSFKEFNNVLQFDQEYQDLEIQNLYQEWLETTRKELKARKERLLRTSFATLFGV